MKKKKLSQSQRRKIIESVVGKVPWEKFAPGIYNDCDRWCERCNKTEKCYLFFEEQKKERPKDAAGLFERISDSLGQTKDLIQKICDAEGIDLAMTPKEEAEYKRKEKLTDPYNDPIAIKANKLSKVIYEWLDSVPSLDITEYKEAYKQVSWHWSSISVKTCMAVHCMKEVAIERGSDKKFAKEQQQKYSWMAYRSTQLCKKSFELMDSYVRDSRISSIIGDCQILMDSIDEGLLIYGFSGTLPK